MNIVALLFPIICYGGYYFVLHLFSATTILSDIWVGLFLGLYVVVMKQCQHRRLIALIHSVGSIILLWLPITHHFLWIYQWGGLSIALTRHDHIQPLCPLPKTRMMIMTCMPLLGLLFVYLANDTMRLPYMISGLLMGFYLWMKERLNDVNRQLVTSLTMGFMLFLALFILKEHLYMWIVWAIFSQIIQIFRVKFI